MSQVQTITHQNDISESKSTRNGPESPVRSPQPSSTWDESRSPANPQNWSRYRKLFLTFIWIYGNLVATISSSIFSSGAQAIQEEFGVSTEVVTLGVSLFVAVGAAAPSFLV